MEPADTTGGITETHKAGDESAFLRYPTFAIEQQLLEEGVSLIAGVDEVGRGALAGPLCVGLVIYEASLIASTAGPIPGINDSKKLTPRKRKSSLDLIRAAALHASSILVSHRTVDRLNINGATEFALNRLIGGIPLKPDIIILDGNFSFQLPVPVRSILKGDAKSISIASASIVAKVHRDAIMERFDGIYPGYHFASNKGYGTGNHLAALAARGLSPIHRRSYEPARSMITTGGDPQ
ncbi:MAG TPA: ribonuclease HII [Spirochaetota bacterium]|nr:ribonuclease HII [Spirochaetota bacterium]HPC39820.1 ribonuclease HII [Spirochaetota bacterium]HPL16314.1 ribonuclease HII [Spirochaetota bacterium]HQF09867.1 ribonuclease HII [Spirochaetota bacterium]HQH98517.1 ribonuclease HII [Spirochaetota bacterium]